MISLCYVPTQTSYFKCPFIVALFGFSDVSQGSRHMDAFEKLIGVHLMLVHTLHPCQTLLYDLNNLHSGVLFFLKLIHYELSQADPFCDAPLSIPVKITIPYRPFYICSPCSKQFLCFISIQVSYNICSSAFSRTRSLCSDRTF